MFKPDPPLPHNLHPPHPRLSCITFGFLWLSPILNILQKRYTSRRGPGGCSPTLHRATSVVSSMYNTAGAMIKRPLRYNFVDHPSVPIFFYARFHCKTLRDRVMRGLGYGSRIERSVVSSRLT